MLVSLYLHVYKKRNVHIMRGSCKDNICYTYSRILKKEICASYEVPAHLHVLVIRILTRIMIS